MLPTAVLDEVLESSDAGYWGGEAGSAEVDAAVIRNGDILDSGRVRWGLLPVRGLTAKELSKAQVHAGDILITTSGYCGQVAHIVDEPVSTTCVTNFVRRLRVDRTRVEPRFLFHFLNRAAFRASLAPFIRGTTMLNLSLKQAAAKVRVPLPQLGEQRRIATMLDAADEVRAKRRESLALLDSLTESIFLDMFGDLDAAWPSVTIGSLAADDRHAIRTGPFGSQLLHSEFVDEGVAVLGIDNAVQDRFAWGRPRFITSEKYAQLSRYQVKPGDVLVTIMATCGRVAIVPEDIPLAINTKHLCCITLDRNRCLPEYLWGAFRFHQGLRRQLGATARGAIMPGLNMGLIKSATLPLPPVDAQEAFCSVVTQQSELSAELSAHASGLDDLLASLQHRAFRGAL